ncbi:MAPEG family protein [Methylorubrum thiocyanatum]|uniref:MAPEG family protein n=1 Tax=Methylorubrum thiocyanatum TaxID=47958 RepID=UPI0035C7C81F
MIYPTTTAFYAAILGLIYAGLSGWVIGGRVTGNVLFGDGGQDALQRRIRSHGNFQEYVPLTLLLIALYEAGGGAHAWVQGLLIVLVIARILHPIGMFAPTNSPRQFACRGGGILATLAVMTVVALLLLLRAG